VTIFDLFRQKVIPFNLRQGYDFQKNLNDSAAIALLALILLLFLKEEKIADKAKPRVIVGRKATPACKNAGVPLSRNAYQPCPPQAGTGRHYGVQARVLNGRDSRVAKAKRFLRGARGLYRSRAFYFEKNK